MKSTMQDWQLTLGALFRHGRTVYPDARVVTSEGESSRSATFSQVADRAGRLAAALERLGILPGDRVGTFAWNTQEHLEAYLAVPGMGAVLHTINVRLFPEQMEYVINHAEDSVLLVEDSLAPLLTKIAPRLKTVRHYVLIGNGDASALENALRYEDLLAGERSDFAWPELDENSAAAMCYTSGTTGNPKGVVYSHRSTFLHSMAKCMAGTCGIRAGDRILLIVPMFHVNAWGLPFAAWLAGADLLLPGRFVQPEPMCRFIRDERPTFAAGVPTIWNAMLNYPEGKKEDFSSVRMILCGGSAVPRKLIQGFYDRYRAWIIQAWGMTETSPVAAVAWPPAGVAPMEELNWRCRTGRVIAGVELRVVDESGKILPRDGKSVGEIEVRGPWITGAYHRDDSLETFHDGWLRTGDIGTVDERGYIQLTDRAKDVIKSGGEWISSVELENMLMGYPDVLEAAVIAVPDDKWGERPLACVVRKPGSNLTAETLKELLSNRIPLKWWVPEKWTFIPEVPKTSVGKFDKKVLRARYGQGELDVLVV
jgi:fatty-acyl-CoA synthase